MSQTPLRWAIGIAFGVGFATVMMSGRLESLFALAEPQPAPVAAPAVAAPSARSGQKPTLTVAADYRGHYIVYPTVDNFRIKMLVDTGASFVALTETDARNLGFQPAAKDYRVQLRTANGVVRGAEVNIREIRLGDILVRNVRAVILPAGALGVSLLGNSFLGQLSGYEVQAGRLLLKG